MSNSGRVVVALLLGATVFVAMGWYDNGILVDTQRRVGANFDPSVLGALWSFGAFALAGSALALGALAWWSRSWIVGVVFVIVGAPFALMPFVALRRGSPAPGWLNDLFVGIGPMSAIIILGAAMAVAGVAGIWRYAQGRRATAVANVSRGRSARPR